MVDARPIVSLTFPPSLLFITRTRKLLHVSNLSKPSCIAPTWRRPDLLPLSFLTCRWYKSKLFLFPHLGIRQHRRLNICKSTNIETAVSAVYWGWSLNFSPLPNNSWVKEPVGVFCSSAHHADNHFNLSLKRQKDGKWLCFTKQDKEQPKTCYLYSSILSVS